MKTIKFILLKYYDVDLQFLNIKNIIKIKNIYFKILSRKIYFYNIINI